MVFFSLVALTLGLVFLGEKTAAGIYFLFAIIPIVYLAATYNQPLFYAFSAAVIIFLVFRAFAPKTSS